MNDMVTFEKAGFGKIRAVLIDGEAWLVGKDVTDILEYQNGSRDINRHVDEEDRKKMMLFDGRQNKESIVINESGLYSLILGSKLPSAKAFKRWVTSEVLPQIRRTGTYGTMGSYLIEDPAERARQWAKEYEQRKALEEKVEEQRPKAQYFDALVDSKLLTNFRDTAKELHLPQNEFVDWLLNNGYIYRDSNAKFKPYAAHVKAGLFQLKDFATAAGFSGTRTLITVKGKETFRLLLQVRNLEDRT